MAPQKSAEQCKIFLAFMESHPDIAKGFCKGDKVNQDQLWCELANLLNSNGPPTRDVAIWKKTWCDWRRSIKTRLGENKTSLKKTGGGDFQQHYISPIEEQLAIVCDIFHVVDGIPKAKSYAGKNKCKKSDYEQEIAQEEPTASTSNSTSPPLLSFETPEMSPERKKKRVNGEIQDLMGEEKKNFQLVAEKLSELGGTTKENSRYLKTLSKSIDEMRSLKRKELEEIKRHHLQMEKIAMSRIETKLEFLKLEKMKMGIPED